MNEAYSAAAKRVALLGLFPGLSGFLFTRFFDLPVYVIVLLLILMGALFYHERKAWKVILHTRKEMSMEIDNRQLRIKGHNGVLIEQINIPDFDSIHLSGYFIGVDTGPKILIKKDLKSVNNISFSKEGTIVRSYNFLIDSYYMKEQLRKIAGHWQANGVQVEEMIINE